MFKPHLASLTLCLLFAPVVLAGRPGEPCLRDAPPRDGHPIFGNPHIRCTLVAEPTDDFVATCFTIADFDGDGDLDVAITNQDWIGASGPAHVTVLLNLGDGVFADPVPYACGDLPACIAGGDLDGDSDYDLVITNATSGQVSVLKNNGDGTFGPPTSYAVGTNPRSVAVGDLDGDNDADLVVMNSTSDNISVLKNNGDGTFAPHVTYAAGPVSQPLAPDVWRYGGPWLAIGDLDNDNDLDVVVPASGFISVLMNNGDGSFAPFVTYPVPYAGPLTPVYCVTIGDWDGDRDNDLATVIWSWNPSTRDLSVFANNGGGTFAPAVTYDVHYEPSAGALMEAAIVTNEDVDADGFPDLAVAFHTRNKVVVLPNNRDGTFAPYVYYDVAEGQRFTDLADLSGDGHPDLAVVARSGRYKLAVLFNRRDGTFITHDSYPEHFTGSPGNNEWNGVSGIATADLDLDDDLDLVISVNRADRQTGNIFVMLNDGLGHFTERGPYRFGDHLEHLLVTDLDGDLWPDVVIADKGPTNTQDEGRIWVLRNNGGATFKQPVSYLVGGIARGIAAGDLDDCCGPDVVIGDGAPPAQRVVVLLNSGSGAFQSPIGFDAGATKVTGVAIADYDGDRRLDVACASPGSDVVTVLRNQGGGMLAPPTVYWAVGDPLSVNGPWAVRAADVDADLRLDLVVINRVYFGVPNVSLYLNEGDGVFGFPQLYSATGESLLEALTLGEVRPMGTRPDAAVGGTLGSSVAFNASAVILAPSSAYGVGEGGPWDLVLGDFDHDGDLDMATANEITRNFSILWNLACDFPSGDFDGDGDVDLSDFVEFQLCYGGSNNPPAPTCPPGVDADLDGDGDVDLADFLIFQQNFTGSR